MKWTYAIEQKTRAAIILAVVFGMMLITNRLDKNYFSALQTSFASVYEDRLLAESYLYRLSALFHQKKLLMNDSVPHLTNENLLMMQHTINDSIHRLVASYADTQLTEPELRIFNNLQRQLAFLPKVEACYQDRSFQTDKAIEMYYQKLSVNLDSLSEIQLIEAKSIMNNSNRIITSSNTISQLEIGMLLLLGLIVQALILASKSEFPRFSQNSNLN